MPPQILPFEFGDEPANAGDLTSVTCAVNKGDQPLEISWTLNGHALRRNNDLGVTITNINKKTSILNIDSVAAIHRGLYYCVAKNAAGIANHSAVLEVNGTLKNTCNYISPFSLIHPLSYVRIHSSTANYPVRVWRGDT